MGPEASTGHTTGSRWTVSYMGVQPKEQRPVNSILEPFMKNPAKKAVEQRGTNPGGTRQACKRPSAGTSFETEAPTAGDNEAEVEGKKKEQEPTQKDTKADASLLLPRAPQVQVQ